MVLIKSVSGDMQLPITPTLSGSFCSVQLLASLRPSSSDSETKHHRQRVLGISLPVTAELTD